GGGLGGLLLGGAEDSRRGVAAAQRGGGTVALAGGGQGEGEGGGVGLFLRRPGAGRLIAGDGGIVAPVGPRSPPPGRGSGLGSLPLQVADVDGRGTQAVVVVAGHGADDLVLDEHLDAGLAGMVAAADEQVDVAARDGERLAGEGALVAVAAGHVLAVAGVVR